MKKLWIIIKYFVDYRFPTVKSFKFYKLLLHKGFKIHPNLIWTMKILSPTHIVGFELCPPPWGVDILFLLFSPSDVRCPASGVRCPASRMVSAHLKEKY